MREATIEGPFLDVAYVYDGSLEGLLSAVFATYVFHEEPTDIVSEQLYQPRLGQYQRTIPTVEEHAKRVERGLTRKCGFAVFDAVKTASLSDDPAMGVHVWRFIRYAMETAKKRCAGCGRANDCKGPCSRTKSSQSVLSDIAHPAVNPVIKLSRAVYNERHRMKQFVRFTHLKNGVWFARCNPSCNVVPLLMEWFSQRFNVQPFIIYDENHKLAGVYDGTSWYLVPSDVINVPTEADDEELMQDAWRCFYEAVAVEARYNPELRRQFMPKRFWKNLTEMQGRPGGAPARQELPSSMLDLGL